jgi:hypothetical protein
MSLLIFIGGAAAQSQKMPAEEIIAKHVESIGKSDLVASSKKRMAVGSSEFKMSVEAKLATGRAILAADGSNNMVVFSTFNMLDYQKERIGVFGDKIDVPFIVPGRRSGLGTFLVTYDKFLNDRIFGGCVFSTWLFLGPDSRRGKFETEGKKKIGDHEAWVINYTPRGGLKNGSYIKLYFDTETYHHLRTVYRQKETEGGFSETGGMQAGAGGGVFSKNTSGSWGNEMANNGATLTEDFEDIRNDEKVGLTLPHKYTIYLEADSSGGTRKLKWTFGIEEYSLVKDFPAGFFSFEK